LTSWERAEIRERIASESLQKIRTKFGGCRTWKVKTVVTNHLRKMFRSRTQVSRTQYCSQDKFWEINWNQF